MASGAPSLYYLGLGFHRLPSTRSTAGRVLAMRDTALTELGTTRPEFEDHLGHELRGRRQSDYRVEGTLTVPNFLTIPDGVSRTTLDTRWSAGENLIDYARVDDGTCRSSWAVRTCPASARARHFRRRCQRPADRELGQLPLSRLLLRPAGGEIPADQSAAADAEVSRQGAVPRAPRSAASTTPTPGFVRRMPTLYGHGLLGSKGEVGGGSTARTRASRTS